MKVYENGSRPGRLACQLCSKEFDASARAEHEAGALHRNVAKKRRNERRRDLRRMLEETSAELVDEVARHYLKAPDRGEGLRADPGRLVYHFQDAPLLDELHAAFAEMVAERIAVLS